MEVFLIRVLQLILALTILVFLHEGGHFFFAKLFGVRAISFTFSSTGSSACLSSSPRTAIRNTVSAGFHWAATAR